MIDDTIAKVKALIDERERIDRELSTLFGLAYQAKRGRPRKDGRELASIAEPPSEGMTKNDP